MRAATFGPHLVPVPIPRKCPICPGNGVDCPLSDEMSDLSESLQNVRFLCDTHAFVRFADWWWRIVPTRPNCPRRGEFGVDGRFRRYAWI
jgi:hypothetical protein